MCLMCTKRTSRGTTTKLLDTNYLTPKSVSNYLGNVFVPDGKLKPCGPDVPVDVQTMPGRLELSVPWSLRREIARLRRLVGFGKRGLLEKGSFQKSPFSRDSREFRDSRD